MANAAHHRLLALDVLRGVALLLVMGRHMYVTPVWHRLGWLGVQLFFVLSGFLVAGLLFREYQETGRLDLRRFFLRRAFKIYPGFYLFLALTLPLAYLTPHPPSTGQILSELLFVQSYAAGYWHHTWSLAVEEHFYLLLGGGLLLLARRGMGADPFAAIPRATAAIGVLVLLARTAVSTWLPFEHQTHVFATHARLDALAFGGCLSYWFHFHRDELSLIIKRHRSRLQWFSAACLIPLGWFEITDSRFVTSLGMTLGYLGLGALLLVAVYSHTWNGACQEGKRGVARILGWLGRNSYGIYLWHMVAALWGVGKLQTLLAVDLPYPVEVLVYFAASILLGAGATALIERPLLSLRDRRFPSLARLQAPGMRVNRSEAR